MLRRIEIARLVEDLGRFRNNQEPVSKPGGDPRHLPALGRKGKSGPLAKRGRPPAKIYRDIKNLTRDHPYQFPLRLLDLVVEPTQDIAHRA